MADDTTLTEEQQQRIEHNRKKALERLALSKKRTADNQEEEQSNSSRTNNKKARWTTFYEYDLSTFENTKGGFIIDEAVEEKVNRFKEEATKIDPYIPYPLDPMTAPKCKDCQSMDIDPIFFQVFHISVCRACKEKYPERYSLITKTEAREDYLLTDPELKDKELLPHWSKPNPRKATWNNMMLYVREMVEEYAFKKWGGPEGLDAEYERRETQKKEKKDKKFKEKLADLRRRTMTSNRERKRQEGPHKHIFGESEEDENGNTIQRCTECNLVIESEEF
ncbi:DNA repair protein RAD14 [Halteromyces radiatus]|uniref:DNA repair protein RAD14 n=1 Tax=Halteromyces radiatus TaxID=101107 RepID=UPI0022206FD8|nr:DNA repair protein RAD14 [Halteromyces radiatus]KAI8089866.1 DNA repair protein RAD14 [Halteromyces radiatus]